MRKFMPGPELILLLVIATAPMQPAIAQADQHLQTAGQAETLVLLRSLAEAGDAEAQFRLGGLYSRGEESLPQDGEQAMLWWRRAAEQGLAEAQNELGVAFADGHGHAMPTDLQQAVEWYRKAAGQGLAVAQANLGTMYWIGSGVRQDDVQAVTLYRQAAEQGLGWAQFYLGEAYASGRGVRRNYSDAAEWYRKAAEQDYMDAQFALGLLYNQGSGVRRDNSRAAYWLAQAARHGHQIAQRNLEAVVTRLQRIWVGGTVDVRSQPDVTAPVIRTVVGNQYVYELNRLDGWSEVYVRGGYVTGYVNMQQLRGR